MFSLYIFLFCHLASASATSPVSGSPTPEARAAARGWVVQRNAFPILLSEPAANDQATELLGPLSYTNLTKMEKAGLKAAELQTAPWSDYYWATFAGQLAYRYADPAFSLNAVWASNVAALREMIGTGDINVASPAEKYDLLVGDTDFTLTRAMLDAGAPFANQAGSVAPWTGLCHGWSAASIMMPRPRKSVTVKTADGRDLEFRPSDLKALATLLWANGRHRTTLIGSRCNDAKFPSQSGERESARCRDTNPSTWHLTVVNQIGINKHSFVMDQSAGREVWNQPVLSYSYSYFNVRTFKRSSRVRGARIRLKNYRHDPRGEFRAPNAAFVVGVLMNVVYVGEALPVPREEDNQSLDRRATATYRYELELDENYEIVGGEWLDNHHPDFLWMPLRGGKAQSGGDIILDKNWDLSLWHNGSPVPASWQEAARAENALPKPAPLERIVSQLLELAQ